MMMMMMMPALVLNMMMMMMMMPALVLNTKMHTGCESMPDLRGRPSQAVCETVSLLTMTRVSQLHMWLPDTLKP